MLAGEILLGIEQERVEQLVVRAASECYARVLGPENLIGHLGPCGGYASTFLQFAFGHLCNLF